MAVLADRGGGGGIKSEGSKKKWSGFYIFLFQINPPHLTGKCVPTHIQSHTDKKENKIFLIYQEITNGLLIYGENICAFPHTCILGSPSSYMTLHPIPSEFLYTLYMRKFCFLFYQCRSVLFSVTICTILTCFCSAQNYEKEADKIYCIVGFIILSCNVQNV